MYKRGTLTSIPEIDAEEELGKKWVPKKKHEVLKAKYKCLKKLFQIYDASVIGILPEQVPESAEMKSTRRRKRSHRTKTDACAGTNELSNGDNTISEYNSSVATAIIRELNIDQSCISTQVDSKIDKYAEAIDSDKPIELNERNCHNFGTCHCHSHNSKDIQFHEHPYPQIPYLVLNEKRKLTRFQCFVQRLFGIRRESYNKIHGEKMHAFSDPTLTYREKRRRRGLRFRRLRRPKKIKSESALRDLKSPAILSCVQSVQKNCLMDMTPRQCPIVGCNMISYGIINYNDHLNLCHFQNKKHICNYCHKGFDTQYEKLVHENEHIGFGKLDINLSSLPIAGQNTKIASDTQTETETTNIPEEKLKKIVSFFDKISDPEQMLSDIKKNRTSETNLTSRVDTDSSSESERSQKARTISCSNLRRKTETELGSSLAESDLSSRYFTTPVICHYCGEHFKHRHQLSLHVDLKHRVHNKFTKYHSCAGIITRPHVDMTSEDGSIKVHSVNQSSSRTESLQGVLTPSTMTVGTASQGKSEASLSCDLSTNIVYYTSVESLRKPSKVDSLKKKVRSNRWEPGTKIIRV